MNENRRGDRPEGEQGKGALSGLLAVIGLGLLFLLDSLLSGGKRRKARPVVEQAEEFEHLVFRGWLIVCGMAVLFTAYGFFAFFTIGDKGPGDWDFGELPDIPGESIYSTYPYHGRTLLPEEQHVEGKPPEAATGVVKAQQGEKAEAAPPPEEGIRPESLEKPGGAPPPGAAGQQGEKEGQRKLPYPSGQQPPEVPRIPDRGHP